jgi:hypothetical protein
MFKQFNKKILPQLNVMWRQLRGLGKMTGDGYINVRRIGDNVALNLNIQKLKGLFGGSGAGGGASMAFVKTAPGAVTTVDCFLGTDTTGTEITVNCSVIGGDGSEVLNEAVPRLIDGSLIFVEQFGPDWWCTTPFIATDDCLCVQEDAVFTSVTIDEDEKFTLDGVGGDTFITYVSADAELETTVDAVKVTETRGD